MNDHIELLKSECRRVIALGEVLPLVWIQSSPFDWEAQTPLGEIHVYNRGLPGFRWSQFDINIRGGWFPEGVKQDAEKCYLEKVKACLNANLTPALAQIVLIALEALEKVHGLATWSSDNPATDRLANPVVETTLPALQQIAQEAEKV